MEAHKEIAGIARWGTQAVGQLLKQALLSGHQVLEACQFKLADGGACQILVGAMDDHAGKADVQMHGTTALSYLALGNDRNRRALGEAGACEALMAAVKRFTIDAAWQHDAAGAIWSLAAVPTNAGTLVAAGACTFVVAVLQANLHNAHIVHTALSATRVLVTHHELALTASGACEAVVQALNAHADNDQIDLTGLSVLVMLARTGEARLRLNTADAGAAAARAMRAFPADPLLQITAVSVIASLSFESEACAAQLTRTGGCALVTAALSTCLNRAEYQQTALFALAVLASSPAASRADAAATCAAAVASLGAHPDVEVVNLAGLLALASLARAANAAVLHDGGARAAVTRAMQRYPHSQNIQTCGELVLQRLPRRSQRAR
ncbi:hypothetical protein JKP88DRAFT_160158 [Tribonema minus]|uniref:Uncharacterized protein n=1 Tax=Tribonema minus TaxID=303371 RepID=A0A835ZEY3_9STRA|nr:hypothetical protein JKP88DRAFT_160158 [Tribonema minus]